MKSLLQLLLLLPLACATSAAQAVDTWPTISPAGEKFSVQMPGPERRVLRELQFEEHLKLVLTSFETYAHDTHFLVLPAAKAEHAGEPEVLKTFERFVEGFKYAVAHAAPDAGSAITDERTFKFENHPAREFKLRLGAQAGVARLYETDKVFYIAVALADSPEQPAIQHFFDSLTFKVSGPPLKSEQTERGGMTVTVTHMPAAETSGVPAGPWPVHQPLRPTQPIKMGIINGKALTKPQPEYPAIAKAAHASGTVVVQIIVDESGKVISAVAISGHQLLQEAAVEAAKRARFTPTLLEGQPVKVTGFVTYNFVLM